MVDATRTEHTVARAARPPLLARYSGGLTVGGVLDETFRIYRRAWRTLAGIMLVPELVYLALFLFYGGAAATAFLAGPPPAIDSAAAVADITDQIAAGGNVLMLAGFLLALPTGAAATALVDRAMRGQTASTRQAYAEGLAHWPSLLGATVIYVLGLALAALLSGLLLALEFFGAVIVVALVASDPFGGLTQDVAGEAGAASALALWRAVGLAIVPYLATAVVGTLLWLARPKLRRGWLKWLIVLATPFGPLIYLLVRWSLWGQAVVLEAARPWQALRRSATLVRGHWFRVFAVTSVVGLGALAVLYVLPVAVVWAAFSIVAAVQGRTPDQGLTFTVASTLGGTTGSVFLGALWYVALTLLFVDLRNRREGADLRERVEQVERAAGAAG